MYGTFQVLCVRFSTVTVYTVKPCSGATVYVSPYYNTYLDLNISRGTTRIILPRCTSTCIHYKCEMTFCWSRVNYIYLYITYPIVMRGFSNDYRIHRGFTDVRYPHWSKCQRFFGAGITTSVFYRLDYSQSWSSNIFTTRSMPAVILNEYG